MSAPGSFPNAEICICSVFPIGFSVSGTRKTKGGKRRLGSARSLIPPAPQRLELLSQGHVLALPPSTSHLFPPSVYFFKFLLEYS